MEKLRNFPFIRSNKREYEQDLLLRQSQNELSQLIHDVNAIDNDSIAAEDKFQDSETRENSGNTVSIQTRRASWFKTVSVNQIERDNENSPSPDTKNLSKLDHLQTHSYTSSDDQWGSPKKYYGTIALGSGSARSGSNVNTVNTISTVSSDSDGFSRSGTFIVRPDRKQEKLGNIFDGISRNDNNVSFAPYGELSNSASSLCANGHVIKLPLLQSAFATESICDRFLRMSDEADDNGNDDHRLEVVELVDDIHSLLLPQSHQDQAEIYSGDFQYYRTSPVSRKSSIGGHEFGRAGEDATKTLLKQKLLGHEGAQNFAHVLRSYSRSQTTSLGSSETGCPYSFDAAGEMAFVQSLGSFLRFALL